MTVPSEAVYTEKRRRLSTAALLKMFDFTVVLLRA